MSRNDDPYSRVYWSIVDDERFRDVYDDDACLAAWLRLLMVADAAWPSSAQLPAGLRKRSLAVLVTAGLVELGSGNRYRMHGLDAERERRAKLARESVNHRYGRSTDEVRTYNERSTSHGEDALLAEPSRDKPRRDETRRADARAPEDDPYDTSAWAALGREAEQLTGQPYVLADPFGRMGQKILGLAALPDIGVPGLIQAWREVARVHGGRATIRQLVMEGEDLVAPIDGRRVREVRDAHEARERAERNNSRYTVLEGGTA